MTTTRKLARKLPYERPGLARCDFQTSGETRQSCPGEQAVGRIGGVAVEELASRFGTPLYVIDHEILERNYRSFANAVARRFPGESGAVAYSYQANPCAAVCADLARLGAWAQTASPLELSIARDVGVPAAETIFHGPGRDAATLRDALTSGCRVVLESPEEVEHACAIAAAQRPSRKRAPMDVLLRVHDWPRLPMWHRFGLTGPAALATARRLAREPGLRLTGLALHLGSGHLGAGVRDPGLYGRAAAYLAELARDLEHATGARIAVYDLGGGFPTALPLLSSDPSARDEPPPPAACVDTVAAALGPLPRNTQVIFEPGRALVETAVYLVTTVVSVKQARGGKKLAILDGGVNLLPGAYWFRHPVHPARTTEGRTEDVDLTGPLCMQIDCVRKDARVADVTPGARLVIDSAGAYSFSQSMQFIFPRGAIAGVRGREAWIAREAETPMDLRGLDLVPARLRRFRLEG